MDLLDFDTGTSVTTANTVYNDTPTTGNVNLLDDIFGGTTSIPTA